MDAVTIIGLIMCIGAMVYMRWKKIPILPKKPSKKPRHLWFWIFPDYGAYPIPKIVGYLLGIVVLILVGLIIWLMFLPKEAFI